MHQESTLERIEVPPISSAGRVAVERGGPARIVSIDVLRGLVMAVMALDHTRDFFGTSGFNPRDVMEPTLFLTRWVTHFCAPTFIFLAGLSAFLYGRGRSTEELSRFLLIRGLWLILIDLTLIKFGWRFEVDLYRLSAGVIFVIGASMVALAALIWLPRWAIAGVSLIMIAGHNLFDGVRAEELGGASWAWHLLHEPGLVPLGHGVNLYVLYPLIPWSGVMGAGYLLGPVMQLEERTRQRVLFGLGAAVTLGFVVLRATNLYGDPAPWTPQQTLLPTVLSFLNCEKYPPSLLYLMMTLGPALMLLASFEHARGAFARLLATFGQVPFFYYVVHLYLIHALAVATTFAMTGVLTRTPTIGLGLPGIYFVWLLVLVLLYPICRWFAELKERGSGWWWSYL
ncbi:MAG: heparan-alpha-glucosaminide N-acetyltransferase domain-containing protein [Methyloceanibacter sp.]